MTNENVILSVIFNAKPGKEKSLKEVLFPLVAPTHQEDGCILYDLHQAKDNLGSFMFHEIWRDQKAFDVHLNQPYIQQAIASAGELLIEPMQLTFWKRV